MAVRTLESLGRIELAAQGGALLVRVKTTRTSKSGVVTTTVRERYTPPDWRADGWFLERRHPTDWSRRTEFVARLRRPPPFEQAPGREVRTLGVAPLRLRCMTSLHGGEALHVFLSAGPLLEEVLVE